MNKNLQNYTVLDAHIQKELDKANKALTRTGTTLGNKSYHTAMKAYNELKFYQKVMKHYNITVKLHEGNNIGKNIMPILKALYSKGTKLENSVYFEGTNELGLILNKEVYDIRYSLDTSRLSSGIDTYHYTNTLFITGRKVVSISKQQIERLLEDIENGVNVSKIVKIEKTGMIRLKPAFVYSDYAGFDNVAKRMAKLLDI